MRAFQLLLLSSTIAAAGFASAEAADRHGWYCGLEGGIVKVNNNNSAFGADVEYENGWAGLAEVGYAFNGHWRVELEGGMRRNEIDKINGFSQDSGDLRN